MMPLEAGDLTLRISGQTLLDGVSFKLSGNAITAVMGFNGAGKSLLLRLLHGLIEATSGTIIWAGRPMSNELRRRQAMVFQKPVLLRRSVAANVDFVLVQSGRRNPARRDSLLERVGLAHLARRPARLLSGGEQQRLALARALAMEPGVLFLDEPTASLDPGSTAMIEDIVKGAQAGGTKIIFVTHDVGQAKRVAGDVLFLHQGKLAEQALAETFFSAPSSSAAQAYLSGRLTV